MTQSSIHVKLEAEEAATSKKILLTSQRDLLISLKFMKQYFALRSDELRLKEKLHRKLKETLTDIKKIEKDLPNPKIPEILKKADEEEYEFDKKQKKRREKYDNDIESQLADIQEKLRNLQ